MEGCNEGPATVVRRFRCRRDPPCADARVRGVALLFLPGECHKPQPARRQWQTPDGSAQRARVWGDEFVHVYIVAEGEQSK